MPADGAEQYLSAAIWPRRKPCYLPEDLIRFNDRCKGFDRIRAVILKARARAQRDLEEKFPQIAAANAVAAQKEEEAVARKRQLLAELERERMVRHATGDSRATYIICPRVPERPAAAERLAA
jgi:plasmid stabilization system protein ParE